MENHFTPFLSQTEMEQPVFLQHSAPLWIAVGTCMIKWIIKNKLGIPNVIHILDDFFFVTRPPRSDCLTALCKILCLFSELNIPFAPGKTFAPTTSLEFMVFSLTPLEWRLIFPWTN